MRIIGPNRRDPRLRLAAVIISLQVLGQTVLGFKLSITQILVSVGVCAAVDIAFAWRQQHALVWPASGLLTGNSVAFILRAAHTQHGDWWSTNGVLLFAGVSLVSILSKYVLRVGGRHVFNPSNLGLVACFLVVGSPTVFPQYLWWGPLEAPVIAALVVILVGAFLVLRPVGMVPMAVAFLLPFAAVTGLRAVTGGCFAAIWHQGPICGSDYWVDVCTSPELLIFVFFMMSDPKTAPRHPRARVAYGALTALAAGALIFFQPTEYGVKVGILAALTITCALVPLMEAAARRWPKSTERKAQAPGGRRWGGLLRPAAVGAALIAVAVPIAVSALASDRQLIDLERGALSTPGAPSPQ